MLKPANSAKLLGLCGNLTSAVIASCLLAACASGEGTAANSAGPAPTAIGGAAVNMTAPEESATDPAYQLLRGDEIAVNVYNENELSSAQRIDNKGVIRLPYLGDVVIAGETVRQAENGLEKLLVEKKLLRKPLVTITVREYSSREVSVLGAIGGAGKFRMPREKSAVEIVDVITSMGGFRPTSKSDEVKVTRILDSGEEKVITVDVEAMINPRKGDRNTPRSFLIYPGDRIFVPERLW
ncbi:MAG TPA: polysaccharide biosynthesis/export family protein [Opitutaceae bacterium]|nr:polysaccharide biosynthesis/export family protein [Opitutaceae bacterium]